MEEKIIYCQIESRCKKIKFVKEKDKSDCHSIRQALDAACQKDVLLKNTMHDKFVVLQYMDPNIKRLCEIEDEDEIPNLSDVTVTLMTLKEPLPSMSSTGMSQGLQDMNVSHNFHGILSGDLSSSNFDSDSMADKMTDKVDDEEGEEYEEENVRVSMEFVPCNGFIPEEVKLKKSNSRTDSIPYPAPLPPLTVELNKYLDTIGIYEKQSAFITFWSTYLENYTNGRPSSSDYTNYARTIVENYPQLKGGKNDYGVVKNQLSTQIRNRRYYIKKRMEKLTTHKRSILTTDENVTGKKKMCINQRMGNEANAANMSNEDTRPRLEKSNQANDQLSMKVVLHNTITACHACINKDTRKIQEIIDDNPGFDLFSLILFEFCNFKTIQETDLLESIENLIVKLSRYFSISMGTEQSRALLFEKLDDQFITNRWKNLAEKLIMISQGGYENRKKKPTKENWPRLVFTTTEEELETALIIFGEFNLNIINPSVKKAVACLLAMYYVWELNSPPCYSGILAYLEQEIFNTTLHNRKSVDKFTRDVEYKLNFNVKKEDVEQ